LLSLPGRSQPSLNKRATMNVEVIHKVVSTLMVGTVVGLIKFYVDVNTELAVLKQQVQQANEAADEILEILDAIAPRRTQ